MLAGTGLHLGAIERHPAELHQPGPLTEQEAVEEERLEGREVAAPELADGLAGGARPAREEHEAHVAPEPSLELARGPHADGIAVEEHLEHHRGVVRGHAPGLVVGGEEG